MTRITLTGAGNTFAWTPASPTSDGGVLPHTWHYAGSGALYQDSAKTTPAVSDGDAIGASVNQGSDTHDIVQATAASKFTLKLNILNGEAVFRSDGGDTLQGAFNSGLSQPFTILAVASLAAGFVNNGIGCFLTDGDDGSNRGALWKNQGATPDGWAIFAGATLNGSAANANTNIWLALFNGASSQFWHNGISQASGDAGAQNMDGLTLGGQNNISARWSGDIAELLIYNSNLSTADKNEVGAYLATKYALSWTTIT